MCFLNLVLFLFSVRFERKKEEVSEEIKEKIWSRRRRRRRRRLKEDVSPYLHYFDSSRLLSPLPSIYYENSRRRRNPMEWKTIYRNSA